MTLNTETVHLAPVGGCRASLYNIWIHWLQMEEPDQFVKRGEADSQPQISLRTAQRMMQTFLGVPGTNERCVCGMRAPIVPLSHCAICCSVLNNVTTYPLTHTFLK